MNAPHFGAKAPAHGASSLTLSCGLLAIPLSIATGTNPQTPIARKGWIKVGEEWHENGSRNYDKTTGDEVQNEEITYRAQASNGVWVDLTDETRDEVLGGKGDHVAEVEAFVPRAALLRDYVPVKWDQARPGRRRLSKGSEADPAAQRVFRILVDAMAERDVVAICKADRQWYALTPEGWWIRLAFADTVRAADPIPEAEVTERELAMAGTLIDTLTVDDDDLPVLENEAADKLRGYVETVAAGQEPEVVVNEAQPAPIDALAAMEASITMLRDAKAAKAKTKTAKAAKKAS